MSSKLAKQNMGYWTAELVRGGKYVVAEKDENGNLTKHYEFDEWIPTPVSFEMAMKLREAHIKGGEKIGDTTTPKAMWYFTIRQHATEKAAQDLQQKWLDQRAKFTNLDKKSDFNPDPTDNMILVDSDVDLNYVEVETETTTTTTTTHQIGNLDDLNS